jgi:hypothetical protein
MVVVRGIGVEIGLGALDRNFPQQAHLRELMQRVVDRGERHRHLAGDRLLMQDLCRDVAVAAIKQQARKGNALARWPQSRRPQALGDIVCLYCHSSNNIWGTAVYCNATTRSSTTESRHR